MCLLYVCVRSVSALSCHGQGVYRAVRAWTDTGQTSGRLIVYHLVAVDLGVPHLVAPKRFDLDGGYVAP